MPDIKISDLTSATSATGAMQLEVNDSGTSKRITVDQLKAFVVSAGSINATALGTDAVTTIKIQNGAVTPAKLSTGGLFWDTSGNVGIGTASPGQKLDVNGAIRTQGWGGGAGQGNLFFGNATSAAQIYGDSNLLAFFTSNAGSAAIERIRIDNVGNVGIGTTDASGWKLRVAGNILSTYQQIDNGTAAPFVGMSLANRYTGGTGVSFIDSQGRNSVTDSHIFFGHEADFSSYIAFATQPAGTNTDRRQERFRIASNGNVGIGTGVPQGALDVRVGNYSRFTVGTSIYEGVTIGRRIGDDAYASIYFDTGAANRPKIEAQSDNLGFFAGTGYRGGFLANGTFEFNSGYGSVATAYGCRAWVNFNGTGTVAIRGSGNVSSITDTGTGSYTVNLSSSMPDANYAVVDSLSGTTQTGNSDGIGGAFDYLSSSFKMYTRTGGNTASDRFTVSCAVFR